MTGEAIDSQSGAKADTMIADIIIDHTSGDGLLESVLHTRRPQNEYQSAILAMSERAAGLLRSGTTIESIRVEVQPEIVEICESYKQTRARELGEMVRKFDQMLDKAYGGSNE